MLKKSRMEPVKNAHPDGISIKKYYGTYNGCVVVLLEDEYTEHNTAMWNEKIGGTTFNYNGGNRILVYKPYEN